MFSATCVDPGSVSNSVLEGQEEGPGMGLEDMSPWHCDVLSSSSIASCVPLNAFMESEFAPFHVALYKKKSQNSKLEQLGEHTSIFMASLYFDGCL